MSHCHVSAQIDAEDYANERAERVAAARENARLEARKALADKLWEIRKKNGPKRQWNGDATAAAVRAYRVFSHLRLNDYIDPYEL